MSISKPTHGAHYLLVERVVYVRRRVNWPADIPDDVWDWTVDLLAGSYGGDCLDDKNIIIGCVLHMEVTEE